MWFRNNRYNVSLRYSKTSVSRSSTYPGPRQQGYHRDRPLPSLFSVFNPRVPSPDPERGSTLWVDWVLVVFVGHGLGPGERRVSVRGLDVLRFVSRGSE